MYFISPSIAFVKYQNLIVHLVYNHFNILYLSLDAVTRKYYCHIEVYDPKSQGCCLQQDHRKDQLYNLESQGCCTNPRDYSSQLYNLGDQSCCINGEIRNNTLCNGKIFDPCTKLCCNGFARYNFFNDRKCCNGVKLVPVNDEC